MEDQILRDDSFFDSREVLTKLLFLKGERAPVDMCCVFGFLAVSIMRPAVDPYSRGLTKWILVSRYGPLPVREPECEMFKAYAVARGVAEAAKHNRQP